MRIAQFVAVAVADRRPRTPSVSAAGLGRQQPVRQDGLDGLKPLTSVPRIGRESALCPGGWPARRTCGTGIRDCTVRNMGKIVGASMSLR